MATAVDGGGRWTRVRTLGRGASGAVVSLAADAASGALFAVKSAPAGAAAAEQLRREARIQSALRSPHVLPCFGFLASADAGGECQLLLEFAPGGSLADAARRGGGRLGERAVRAYAADVARGLAYLHARSVVHGDVKPANVVLGADGRAKLADFGCARAGAGGGRRPGVTGGTPAFMAPEVARGDEQGPAADVWALGCTVLELATGRAPWGGAGDDSVLAAVRRIGYTDATPEVPPWMSADAKDFLARCFARDPRHRCAAARLLEHPFLAASPGNGGCGVEAKDEEAAAAALKWVSPKSALDAALWDSDDEGDVPECPAQRIKALAGAFSALPDDWDSEESDWIEVLSQRQCEASRPAPSTTKETAGEDDRLVVLIDDAALGETETESSGFVGADAEGDDEPECAVVAVPPLGLTLTAPPVSEQQHCWRTCRDPSVPPRADTCHHNDEEMPKPFSLPNRLSLVALSSCALLSVLAMVNDDPDPSHCAAQNGAMSTISET